MTAKLFYEAMEKEFHQLNAIINTIAHPMALISSDYRYMAVNDIYSQLFNTTREEILDHAVADFCDPNLYQSAIKPQLDLCMTGATVRNEVWMSFPGKGQCWMEMEYFPYRDKKEDRITCIISHGKDITDHKLHEQVLMARLRLSEYASSHTLHQLLQAFIDEAEELTGSSIGFFHFLEPDEKSLSLQMWSSHTLAQMCQVENIMRHYPISQAGVWVDCIRQRRPVLHNDYANLPYKKGLPEGHAPVQRELVVPVQRNRKIVAILGVGNKLHHYTQNDVHIVNELAEMAWDIVMRKQAEENRIESENRLKEAQRIAQIGSWELDLQKDRLYWSDEVYRIFEFDPTAHPPSYQAFLYIIHPDDRQRVDEAYQSAMKQKTPYNIEHRLLFSNGRIKFVHEQGETYFDSEGKPVRFLGTVQDITTLKEMEARQIEYERRIQNAQKLEAIGTLAGGIAHDFNNILFPLIGYAEILKEDIDPDDPRRTFVDEIMRAALRSRDLVNQILTFSRQNEQELKPIRLQSIIKEAIKLLRASIPTTINIHTQIDSDCNWVVADPTQIHQIIMNLATNAYHAMENSGGTLTITLNQVQLEPELSALPKLAPGDYALLSVSDTGIGISQNILHKICDPYFTTKSKTKGTGLGLFIVQGIVKSCNGDIRIYSEPDQGTQVKIYLPVVECKTPVVHPASSEPLPGGTERILLVDDEEAIAKMEQKILERLGYRVTIRTASTEAHTAFQAEPEAFDLLVTDMTMPNMTGIQLANKIRAIKPNIPVVICTGFSDQISQEKYKGYGIHDFVNKPVLGREFAKAIRNALDGTKTQKKLKYQPF